MKLFAQTRGMLSDAAAELLPPGPESDWAGAVATGWQPDSPDAYCHRCGVSAGPGAATAAGCSFCRGQPQHFDRVVRLAAYEQPMKDWLTAMKFHHQWSWCPLLGRELARRMDTAAVLVQDCGAALPGGVGIQTPGGSPVPRGGPEAVTEPMLPFPLPAESAKVVVCPVPMHWFRRWRRGYNQARLMAQEIARRRGWVMTDLLRRCKYTAPQTAVPPSKRAGNVRGSFALERVDLAGWDVWLVDDIKTSGATLNVCARLLHGARARSVNVAVAAVANPAELRASASGKGAT